MYESKVSSIVIGFAIILVTSVAQNVPSAGQQPAGTLGQFGGNFPNLRGVVVPMTRTLGMDTYGHTVGDLDAAIAFYRDAVGFEVVTPADKQKANLDLAKLV